MERSNRTNRQRKRRLERSDHLQQQNRKNKHQGDPMRENIEYQEWKKDNETTLKEEFIMGFTHEELRNFLMDEENNREGFHQYHNDEFNDYCDQMFTLEMDCREVEK